MRPTSAALMSSVYPRPRGGTVVVNMDGEPVEGLSPPTRGNPPTPARRQAFRRSIPAHAGEPRPTERDTRRHAVYPRPRGGTGRVVRLLAPREGLSPPTRGNQVGAEGLRTGGGSIPAHAGEPAGGILNTIQARVYPRPRGGTRIRSTPAYWRTGLSPPTRGNPIFALGCVSRRRSIPAHAGEPSKRAQPKRAAQVYPRPRGGTGCPCRPTARGRGLSPPTRGNR